MKHIMVFLSALLITTIAQSQTFRGPTFDSIKLKEHIVTLASDSFQGRRPFTIGETRTINYLTQVLTQMGLVPGNRGSYLQEVAVQINNAGVPHVINISGRNGEIEMKANVDYAARLNGEDPRCLLQNQELVFVGYGITAPAFHHNDYDNISVKDKVVVVLMNDRGAKESFLQKGRPLTYYETVQYKFEEAERRGARACLLVQPSGAVATLKNVQASLDAANLNLKGTGNFIKAIISRQALSKLLALSGGIDSSDILLAAKPGFKPMSLGLQLSTSIKNDNTVKKSWNIVATIPGTKRPAEAIVYSAHWDHFGFGKPDEKGDSIYNGASDNAIGVAVLLELASAFKKWGVKPERTIVFLFPTLEEFGFLGSLYYTTHKPPGQDKIIANINLDGFNRYGRTKDMMLIGPGRNDLEEIFRKELAKQGRRLTPDPAPAENYYFRSDHLNFAKSGVPVLFTLRGTDYVEGGTPYETTVRKNYYGYHTPNDEYNEGWRFDGTLEDMEVFFKLGLQLANGNIMPKWNSLSEFQ
jgi:hypothetical protein